MRNLDFSSWQALLSTLLGLAVITLIGVGIRLVVMQTIQMRRERENRQINERLRTLIAAYKTLGGSFTGNLAVDPTHLRDLRRASIAVAGTDAEPHGSPSSSVPSASSAPPSAATHDAAQSEPYGAAARDAARPAPYTEAASSDRPRRIRDAVEAALSDIILLGTEEQVRLAARAATELAQGRPIHTAELVVSLRNFIRSVLNLEPVPPGIAIPAQGPARPSGSRARDAGRDAGKAGGGGGGKGGGGMSGGMGAGMGMGAGLGLGRIPDDDRQSS